MGYLCMCLVPRGWLQVILSLLCKFRLGRLHLRMVEVGKCITAAPIQGLPFFREPTVYIHSIGLCRSCHGMGCGGDMGCLCCNGVVDWEGVGIVSNVCCFV